MGLCVCDVMKHPLLGVVETPGQRMFFKYWPAMTQLKKNKCCYPVKIVKCAVLDSPQKHSLLDVVETSG